MAHSKWINLKRTYLRNMLGSNSVRDGRDGTVRPKSAINTKSEMTMKILLSGKENHPES
jgi:hypothetical protein